jgi:hypothetical protein
MAFIQIVKLEMTENWRHTKELKEFMIILNRQRNRNNAGNMHA